MNRAKAENYADDAIAALAKCKTDAALVKWSDVWANSATYIGLPGDLVRRMEKAYEDRVAYVTGWGAG